jgi:hypothetical protein
VSYYTKNDGNLYKKDEAGIEVPVGFPTPAWINQQGTGSIFAALGAGDPVWAAYEHNTASVAAPTQANIGTTVARCVLFRLPRTLAVAIIHMFGIGASGAYNFGIYARPQGSPLLWSASVSPAANVWSSAAITGLTLNANTDYWFCIATAGAGVTAGFRSPAPPVHSAQFGADAAPLGGRLIGIPVYAQFAVTGGALPANLPVLAAAAYAGGTTGSVPFAWLEGTAS